MHRDSDPLAVGPPDLLQLLHNKINVVLVEEQPLVVQGALPLELAMPHRSSFNMSGTVGIHLNSTSLYCQRNTIKRLMAMD